MPRSSPVRIASAARNTASAQKQRRSHAQRREEAEQRMLDAAVRIVAERGIEVLTLAECGEAAGYSRGLAAHYFGSKDELIAGIAEHIVSDYAQRLRGSATRRKGLDGFLDSVEFYIESGRTHVLQLRAFNAVLGSGPTHPLLADAIARLNRESAAGLARGLESCRQQKAIRADVQSQAQATLILATVRGLMSQWLLDPNGIDLDLAKAELLRSLRRSLAP